MTTDAPATLTDGLRRLVAALRIVHHIPGRIRLKLEAAAGAVPVTAGDAGAFDRALSGLSGIRSVRLNPLARSCTIEYDPALIPPSAWPDLLAGRDTPGAAGLLRLVATAGIGPAV
ncbi:heavy-metal-associated domain-containing protein [Azospirillum halopraeferens]|uniref:heavy-metal-associated domain-containing protein n=1 Tax=Azospirillum halopraeferens TaxID=34010 RepID=UPI0004122D59|nr:heavy-metal-associated domain-containing protein [Azospirillum halopraeferens]